MCELFFIIKTAEMLFLDLLCQGSLFYDEVLVHVLVNFTYIQVNLIINKELNAICEKVGPVNIDANFFEGGQIEDWFVACQEISLTVYDFSLDQ